uniref:Prephenate dehydratase domain-containing protein n=1 Tax=Hordeum vulgare subsp. vulgare TaxID=112509 RepID=A0A8I6XXB4_HORVV
MTASSSSSLRIPAPTHHPAAGARPLRLPFHSVSVRPRRSPVSASASPQQAPGPGDGDRANGRTGVPVPVPFSHDAAITLPRPLTSANLMGEASGEGLKVAYQGCPGAYSEATAKKACPSCETVPCEYFETTFQLALILVTQVKVQFLEEGYFLLLLFLGLSGGLKLLLVSKIKVKLVNFVEDLR